MKHSIAAVVAVLLLSGCGAPKAPTQGSGHTATQPTSLQNQVASPAETKSVFSADGDWKFGYTAGKALVLDDIRPDGPVDAREVVNFWHPSPIDQSAGRYYPYVARNMGNQVDASHGWAVRPGEFAMEGSAEGQYSVVIFTPHQAGLHHVNARFEGIHFNLSTTDVHVLHNGYELFAANINGYGGDPKFHPVVGANPTATFSDDIELREGDTLAFAVGVGQNGNYFCDTTGLIATISFSRGAK